MGTISTALRTYAATEADEGTYPPTFRQVGLLDSDLDGTYFDVTNYTITHASFDKGANPELTFIIQCDHPGLAPSTVTLNEQGIFTP